MFFDRLNITNIRNLHRVTIDHLEAVNIFAGQNGSGKTSFLESLHLLSQAKSFRTRQTKRVITHGKEEGTVFGQGHRNAEGQGEAVSIGVQRHLNGELAMRLNGNPLYSVAELSREVPVQVFHAQTFALLEAGPSYRRKFIDWGVFHVEHSFFSVWQQWQRALKQRNALLRHGKIERSQLGIWTEQFVRYGTEVDRQRQRYVAALKPVFEHCLGVLSSLRAIELIYTSGWKEEATLEEVLAQTLERDRQRGATQNGPHRADLRLSCDGVPVDDVLSRGQVKLVICALKLAQGALLAEKTGQRCLYLIDDLPAELDAQHRGKLCQLLEAQGHQLFITAVEPSQLATCWEKPQSLRMFHVEHGDIRPIHG